MRPSHTLAQGRSQPRKVLKVPLANPENHLPRVLRDSNIPWEPEHEDQAATPRPGDSWYATLGALELLLLVDPDPSPEPYCLFLYDLSTPKQIGSFSFHSLEEASSSADAHIHFLLTQLRSALNPS